MFDSFIDWTLDDQDLVQMLELMSSVEQARDAYDNFYNDWVKEEVANTDDLETPEAEPFDFGKLFIEFEKGVMSILKTMSPAELVELQDNYDNVFEDMDLRPIQSQLLTGKLLRDLSEKPERVLVKI